jgi:hypothetical protein
LSLERIELGRHTKRSSRATSDDSDFSKAMKERRRWKAVLNKIYSALPHEYGIGKEGITDAHPLAKRLKIPGQELMLSLSFLEDYELIKYRNHNEIILTERGFEVALENEKSMNNVKLQAMTIFVSLILAITAIFNFVNSTNLLNTATLMVAYLFSLAIMYVCAFRIFSK